MKNNLANLRKAARSASNLPTLSQTQIANRWRVDPDTARKILKEFGPPPVPGPWKRARYALLDIWCIEGISPAKIADPVIRADLLMPLKTAQELAQEWTCDPATVRNWARVGRLPFLRLGGSLRFHHHAVRDCFDAT